MRKADWLMAVCMIFTLFVFLPGTVFGHYVGEYKFWVFLMSGKTGLLFCTLTLSLETGSWLASLFI